ncbi:MAG: hypothetical protein KF832_02510 [Caldilineaceae bacterium]|nr:hypothetical protein [Caldilineaceae bacterium]
MNHLVPKRWLLPHSWRRFYQLIVSVLCALLALLGLTQIFWAQDEPRQATPAATPFALYLPFIANRETPRQIALLDWDSRLTERGAALVEAEVAPGQGYWQLVKARWYDPVEAGGRHHILVDLLDEQGARMINVPVIVTWNTGNATIYSEAKLGEPYATNYAMYALAPAYAAQPDTDAPADRVEGMGLGTIGDPYRAFHTSYGLTWRWTVAASAPTATPTTTLTPMATTTPTQTTTPTVTLPPILTGTPTDSTVISATLTATPTPTPSVEATPTATATATPTATPTAPPLAQASFTGCQPNDAGSRFEGYVYVDQQPANGYRVVFSYEADGPWVTQPATAGNGAPGYYTHIISAGVARAGTWHAWLVNQANQRISTIATFTTDGVGGACNIAAVDFWVTA